jgi:hypothetical protein
VLTVNDIQKCKEKVRRYIEGPDKFAAEFQIVILGYDLSWKYTQFLLVNCSTPTEKGRIVMATHREANEAFCRDP